MKKVVIVFAVSLLFAIGGPNATAVNTTDLNLISVADQDTRKDKDKEEVSVTDLPSTVQNALNGDAYREWNPTKAWKVEKDDETVYKVEVTNGTETQMLKFDEDGKYLASKDKDDMDHKRK